MKNLTALADDPPYIERYISIRDKKRIATRQPLIAAHALIEQRYDDLAQAIDNGAMETLTNNAEAVQLSDYLRACYDSPTKALTELKRSIQEAQPTRLLKYCPMCGTTLPKTFDHYLPAVGFPEFAVHPLNLVPCCGTCNSTKNEDWLTPAGVRQYLHAYTDRLPNIQFVQVALHQSPRLAGVGATFSIQQPAQMPNALWALVSSHFSRLKLISRYDENSNFEVNEILSDCCTFLEAGGQDARRFLQGQAADRAKVYGLNHWIAVLMEAMANHPDLDDWIEAAR